MGDSIGACGDMVMNVCAIDRVADYVKCRS